MKPIVLTLLAFSSLNAFSEDLKLKCASGWFSSFDIVQKNDSYVFEGREYPSYSDKVNSRGYHWAKQGVVKKDENELQLLWLTVNVDTDYISEMEYFILDRINLSYVRGVEIGQRFGRNNIYKNLRTWSSEKSGVCEIVS